MGQAYKRYLVNNPNNEFRSIFPIQEGPWQDSENDEFVAADAREVLVRNRAISLPSLDEYASHGIELEQTPRVQIFELCRFFADSQESKLEPRWLQSGTGR